MTHKFSVKLIFTLTLTTLYATCFSQTNIQLLGHLPYANGVDASNLTGYVDSSGHEYALVGTSEGLSIVDIDTPSNPHEVFLVPGAVGNSGSWREVREYKGYAYVTTEQNSGLVVVNLNYLPDSIQYHTINPIGMRTSHTIFIDEKGIAYVNGTDRDLLFLDLNVNPWNPPVLGRFTNNYVHDCYARNDTLWAACINDGIVKVIDVRNKTTADAPGSLITSWSTPIHFSHNCWLSNDSRFLFTTDEKPNSTLTCYDVSDLSNVTEISRTQVDPGTNTIIHNTYYMNDFCITSYYTYGISIHDVTRKNNMIKVGNFDTSPGYSGNGFHGAWGVWPYLPSGNIIVSDIETGLWILKPTYKRAAYLEGIISDSICNNPLSGATIEVIGTNTSTLSSISGTYATGILDSGTYTIRITRNGYFTKTLAGVSLMPGQLTSIDVELIPNSTTNVTLQSLDSDAGTTLPNTIVLIEDTTNSFEQQITTDGNGIYQICNFVQSSYDFYTGKWGYVTTHVLDTVSSNTDTLPFTNTKGYYDDFLIDFGWTVSSTASSGIWERGVPLETDYNGQISNVGNDVNDDFGKICYVTGNNGGQAGEDDVDDGYTKLVSPPIDLSTYQDPYLNFYYWFFNDGGQGTPPNDSLKVIATNGIDSVVLMTETQPNQQWTHSSIKLNPLLASTSTMRIYFIAMDVNPGHLVEAAIDKFEIADSAIISGIIPVKDLAFKLYPNPVLDKLTIETTEITEGQVSITDILGKQLYAGVLTKQKMVIDSQNLNGGVYIVSITDKNGFTTEKKFIKQ